MKTRILSLVLTVIAIAALCSAMVGAADYNGFTIAAEAGEIADGKIHVDIVMANNSASFAAVQLGLSFDNSIVRVTGFDTKWDEDAWEDVMDTCLSGTVTTNLAQPNINMAALDEVTYVASQASNYKRPSGKLIGLNFEIIDMDKLISDGIDFKVTVNSMANQAGDDVYPNVFSSRIEFAKVENVSLDTTSVDMKAGETVTLNATVSPAEAYNKAVVWSSSNETVATVDANGKVTAVSSGSAVITVTTVDGGKTATCDVTVVVPVTSVAISNSNLVLTVGAEKKLTASVKPSNATNKDVKWTSSDKSVVTVDASGNIKVVGKGSATVTVETVDGGFTASCKVVVTVPVTGVKLSKTTLDLGGGSSETLVASVLPADATNQKVTWSSSDETVATVDANGKITAVKAGTAKITVTTADGGFTATCDVNVKIPVESVSLNKTELALYMGKSETLVASILPENAEIRDVTWTTSDANVATVDANGKVTAVTAGEAVITVTTKDGGKTAQCTVTVSVDPNAPQFVIDSTKARLGKEFTVNISVVNNPGIAGATFGLDYDTSALTLTAINYNTTFGGTSNFDQDPTNNPVFFSFSRASDFKGTFLAELTFKVKEDAPVGDYQLKLIHDGIIVNQSYEKIAVSMIAGTVNVTDVTPGDLNDDGAINSLDAVMLAQYLAHWNVPGIVLEAADCHADGKIDSSDAVKLAQYLAHWNVTLG